MIQTILGLALILIAAGLLFYFGLPARNRRARAALRSIPAFTHLRQAIGLTVENGTRLHVSLGQSSIVSPNSASALVGLSALDKIGSIGAAGDRSPIATSGDGTLAVLSQDTLRSIYRQNGIPEQYSPTQGRLAGPTPFSYIAGTLPVMVDEHVSTHVLVGNFGPEVALLAEAADRENSFMLTASDAIAAQAVLYATAGEPLIGEELFAVPAYLQSNRAQLASLRTQDTLRWLVIGALLIGSFLSLLGLL